MKIISKSCCSSTWTIFGIIFFTFPFFGGFPMFCIYTNEERNPKRVLRNKNYQCIPSHPVAFVKRFSLFYFPAKWNNFHTFNPRPWMKLKIICCLCCKLQYLICVCIRTPPLLPPPPPNLPQVRKSQMRKFLRYASPQITNPQISNINPVQ